MDKLSSCTGSTSDVPAVNSTLEHLSDLAERMRHNYDVDGGVTDEINSVISAIKEMEIECQQLHEKLETVTIKSSVLRYRLRTFPEQFKAEMKDAMAAAHQLNAAQIKELKGQLKEIEESIRLAVQKNETVELHNAVLEPELKQKSEQYESLVTQLNTSMADKAELQILLNEKREQMSATKMKIALLESEVLHLQRTMEQERAKAQKESDSVDALIVDNKATLQETRNENSGTRRQVAKLKDELVQSEDLLSSKKLVVKQAVAARDEILQLEESLKKQVEDAQKQVSRSTNRTSEILSEHETMRREFERRKQELNRLHKQLREDLKSAVSENSRIARIRKEVKAEFRMAKDKSDEEAGTLASMQDRVSTSRHEMVHQAEECARLRQEMNELGFRKARIEETHKTNLGLLNESISGTRDMLARERAERQKMQSEHLEISSAKAAMKKEQNEELARTTQRINSAVQNREQLTQKSKGIRQQLEDGDQTVNRLRLELEEANSKFVKTESELETEIKTHESSIEELTTKLHSVQERLAETQPRLDVVQQKHDEWNSSYETKKKEIVGLKNKRAGLQDSTTRAQREIEKMHIPHETLQRDIGRERVDTLMTMKSHVAESKAIECDIHQLQAKLDGVEYENARLNSGIDSLWKDEQELSSKHERTIKESAVQEKELHQCEELLQLGFQHVQELEREFALHDRQVLERLAELSEKSEQRQCRVTDVHGKICGELGTLRDFLEVIGAKRPKDGFLPPDDP